MKIEGTVALVTGANRGIGKAFVDALLEGGATKVYAAVRDPSTVTSADPRVRPVRLDVIDTERVAASRASSAMCDSSSTTPASRNRARRRRPASKARALNSRSTTSG